MNYIEVNGGRKVERELADRIISWCVFKLLPRHSTLEITLNFEELEKAFGYCLEGDTNSEFELSISKSLPVEDLVATICHEMIHVKQYARNEMSDTAIQTKFYKWKDTLVPEMQYFNKK